MKQHTKETQPWVTCFLSNILVTHLEEVTKGDKGIDYPALFKSTEGFRTPVDPESYLKDVNNWVPLSVHRELLWQCETISGRKDFAYHAARAYFDPSKKQLPSLFEIIAHVLNDVRSLLICADLWASVQSNYLKFQSFEGPKRTLYMLAQFVGRARPNVASMHFLRGTSEGFVGLCSFIDDVQCTEELSQLEIGEVVREFPGFETVCEGDRLSIYRRGSPQSLVEAIKIPLKTEIVSPSSEFMATPSEAVVVHPKGGRIHVLVSAEETNPMKRREAPSGYKIAKGGVLSHGTLLYAFTEGQIFNTPYSRLRFGWTERSIQSKTVSSEYVSRRDVSRLLFDHLKQIKQTSMHIMQDNIEKGQLTLENIRLRREIEREYSFGGMLGQSEKMQDLLDLVRSIAETDVTALIQGETGTGKELIARAIHYNSPRSSKRFVAINCGSLTETLLESELFGHEKGAFTGATTQRKGIFEVADGGTLFLDEIGEIPPSTQVKLLRVLQEGEFVRVGDTNPMRVDLRILAATNQNLEELIKAGRFRQDLYYRLNVVPIFVPPLRERLDDIPLLVSHFIEKSNRKLTKRVRGLNPQAMDLLIAYHWPGNVREMENVIQRMMVVTKGDTLDIRDLPPEIRGKDEGLPKRADDLKGIARGPTEAAEKRAILDGLTKTRGNITQAARSLGISRVTLQKRMKTYKLRGPSR